MEKLTADIIKETMIGVTNGHMATIPNSPIIHGIFHVFRRQSSWNDDDAFLCMLEEMVEALKGNK